MIKTKFDNSEYWETKDNIYEISEMETSHILNLINLFNTKPIIVMNILLESIESSNFAFTKYKNKQAVNEVTSLSEKELIDVAMNSVLVAALLDQLEERGVNVENVMQIYADSIIENESVESEVE